MTTVFLAVYLVLAVIACAVIAWFVLNVEIPPARVFIPAVAAVFLLPIVLAYVYSAYFTFLPETVVPEVRGMAYRQAEQMLGSTGLLIEETGSVDEADFPEGTVISQRPEPGSRVKSGRTVKVITSAGGKIVIVPNLVGRDLYHIEDLLDSLGLVKGEIKYEKTAGVEENRILAQNPLPGESSESGGGVDLIVSTTKETEGEKHD